MGIASEDIDTDPDQADIKQCGEQLDLVAVTGAGISVKVHRHILKSYTWMSTVCHVAAWWKASIAFQRSFLKAALTVPVGVMKRMIAFRTLSCKLLSFLYNC
ncbi:hypothetical protein HCU01_22170 [Halomonas cupida]|uniref:BTB domain-containing protein n=1 Tax=Halomonas cupida TaxID=44933 RepID=A0ABQ0WG10_9GAMM|nr:hypothetical protein HCU01_22170 [Halomonas cupida]